MRHLGDITKISGYDAPAVDVIIGGSPCQDLSVAGKRAGLAGERSGLYMEQIRIIREMREADVLRGRTGVSIRPRYMVWENVPGAFSSNKGKDFAAVLEEAIRVAEPQAPPVSVPEKGWPTSGCYYDVDGRWSVAWRVLDAQFYGVPQRRRRIALVADFGGLSAPEILFVRKGVSGNIEPSQPQRKETATASGAGAGGAGKAVGFPLGFRPENVRCYEEQATTLCNGTRPGFTTGVIQEQPLCIEMPSAVGFSYKAGAKAGGIGSEEEKAPTLSAERHDAAVCYPIENHPQDSRVKLSEDNVVQTLSSKMGTGGGNTPMILEVHGDMVLDDQGGSQISVRNDGKSPTLRAEMHGNIPAVMEPAVADFQTYQRVTGPLMANSHPGSYTGQDAYNDMLVAHTLKAKANCDFREDSETYPITNNIVRRLTTLECERLQGYPDGWTDIGDWIDSKGKKHKEADSPKYKALGNSIAIPPWKWILKRLCACYERDATMASLFDGIGGFPYIWEQLNGKGSCLWASEIEEFPMAVTRIRFGDEQEHYPAQMAL